MKWLDRFVMWLDNGCRIGCHDWETVEQYYQQREYLAGRRMAYHRVCLNCGKQIDEITEGKRLDAVERRQIDARQRQAREMVEKAKP